jgi:hypothetical protein
MDGMSLRGRGYLTDPGSSVWKVVASADFNEDGKLDLVFQNSQTGQLVYWLMNRMTITNIGYFTDPGPVSWRVVGTDDFNGDGKADLLFQNQQTGQLVYWLLNGVSLGYVGYISPDDPGSPTWKVAAVWAAEAGSASGIIQ